MTKNDKAVSDKSVMSTQSLKKPAPDIKPPGQKAANPNWSLRILGLLLIFIGGTVTSIYFMPTLKDRIPFIANWIGEGSSPDFSLINQALLNQQAEIDALKTSLDQLSMTTTDNFPTDLEARITILEESLIAKGQTPQNIPATTIDPSQSTRIDLLLSRMSQLEASFVPLSNNLINAGVAEKERRMLMDETLSITTKISSLESRLQSVEQVAAKDNSGILLNLKIAELKRKVMAGVPYDLELSALNNILEKNTAIENSRFNSARTYLSEQSGSGIITPGQLEKNFNDIIPDILSISSIDVDASWWQNTVSSLKNMVTVRKTDGSSYSEDGLDSIISETEMWLRSANIKSALDTVAKLPLPAQALLNDWKIGAEGWLNSEDAIRELESIATESYLKNNVISAVISATAEAEL